ncbi:hypothetical protein OCV88_03145 [Brotonthovivens ammoniilytica]|uniref:Uncharacterized protein n=1 Tax=Brotonthovivens ammoniilytica TaxID=2981725 RepID=A0ABT2TGM1_9FIRM|nr:hypothetical protein [Brotonthovivens ammoniilytica]MCU6761335.1 hypothetical protein [Brotonthovivens ammoniilytica]
MISGTSLKLKLSPGRALLKAFLLPAPCPSSKSEIFRFSALPGLRPAQALPGCALLKLCLAYAMLKLCLAYAMPKLKIKDFSLYGCRRIISKESAPACQELVLCLQGLLLLKLHGLYLKKYSIFLLLVYIV